MNDEFFYLLIRCLCVCIIVVLFIYMFTMEKFIIVSHCTLDLINLLTV